MRAENPKQEPKDIRRVVGTIVFAQQNGNIYALSVQRANVATWNRQLIFGGAGHVKKGEKNHETVKREIREELGIPGEKILRIRHIGYSRPTRPEHLNLHGSFYLVEVPFETLQGLVKDINHRPSEFGEVRSARLNRIQTIGRAKRLVQPHYREFLPRIQQGLRNAQEKARKKTSPKK